LQVTKLIANQGENGAGKGLDGEPCAASGERDVGVLVLRDESADKTSRGKGSAGYQKSGLIHVLADDLPEIGKVNRVIHETDFMGGEAEASS
jgi:hypothetical protein